MAQQESSELKTFRKEQKNPPKQRESSELKTWRREQAHPSKESLRDAAVNRKAERELLADIRRKSGKKNESGRAKNGRKSGRS